MDYEVVIPEEAQSWVSVIDTRSDLRQEMLNFKVEANTQAAPRQTLVELQTNGATLETILIFQEANTTRNDGAPGRGCPLHGHERQIFEHGLPAALTAP